MNKCQRCGLCCKGRGDIAYGCDTVAEDTDCPALEFDGAVAICAIERDCGKSEKPRVCKEYPFADMDNGMCERELNIVKEPEK